MAVDFALTAEQREIQSLAHDFAATEMRPRAVDADEQERTLHGSSTSAWAK